AFAAPPSGAETAEAVAPARGAVVQLLSQAKRDFLSLPREERRVAFTNQTFRSALNDDGDKPLPVVLEWTLRDGPAAAPRTVYTVEVRRVPDGLPVFLADVAEPRAEVRNLEIGRKYVWKVWARRGGRVVAQCGSEFSTEPMPPRLFDVPERRTFNARDLGGRVGLGGRRIRQGMLFRTSGFNHNASETEKPGRPRVSEKSLPLFLATLGVKTDIDLRSDGECEGMTGSPLGPTVEWAHVETWAYEGVQADWCKDQYKKIFAILLDPAKYPVSFHCIAGADRTGSLAFVIEALLGVDEEELWRDWETTAFYERSASWDHASRFDKLVVGFDRYPGDSLEARVVNFFFSLGFTETDLAALRALLLE
ncbi:MAG: tyrosine-protein phosphatase, partial [Kiritimatiellae bacterium]|nr:tyrosine-protein phosphatase [Kiritimatiellia bacterium]